MIFYYHLLHQQVVIVFERTLCCSEYLTAYFAVIGELSRLVLYAHKHNYFILMPRGGRWQDWVSRGIPSTYMMITHLTSPNSVSNLSGVNFRS